MRSQSLWIGAHIQTSRGVALVAVVAGNTIGVSSRPGLSANCLPLP
jgi:hypothetical protein